MRIESVTIPHDQQRYPTTGDWWFEDDTLQVRVSKMGNWRFEFLVAVHEIIEAGLCKARGIAESNVTRFDQLYELARSNDTFGCGCTITEESEPGDDFHAPYYFEHQIATGVERILAARLDVDWNAYEKANLDLYATDAKS